MGLSCRILDIDWMFVATRIGICKEGFRERRDETKWRGAGSRPRWGHTGGLARARAHCGEPSSQPVAKPEANGDKHCYSRDGPS